MIRVLVLGALGAVFALGAQGAQDTRGNGPQPAPAEWFEATQAEAIAGFASRYDPGLMATVLRNRGLELASYHRGAVSLMRRGDLRREVWIRVDWPEGIAGLGDWLGPYLVADCAGRANFWALVEIDRAVEFSAAEWRALGLPDGPDLVPVPVIVSFAFPWPREGVGPLYY